MQSHCGNIDESGDAFSRIVDFDDALATNIHYVHHEQRVTQQKCRALLYAIMTSIIKPNCDYNNGLCSSVPLDTQKIPDDTDAAAMEGSHLRMYWEDLVQNAEVSH